ncbi:hypothetical protein EYZ11_013199 [Aspergillus tanneri]|uniref:Uncharacterized protein n=1 Tax=Aspergillus tanneri TaxID=1220188 RepID=A0A4S3J0G7_9EURO|nr:hypothetical protein EYZ11_013199 [Aspergillus tanneri]
MHEDCEATIGDRRANELIDGYLQYRTIIEAHSCSGPAHKIFIGGYLELRRPPGPLVSSNI